MKKIFGIILSLCLAASFVSCDLIVNLVGNKDDPNSSEQQKTEEPTQKDPEEIEYTRPERDELVHINPKAAETRVASLDFIFNTETLGKTTIVIRRSEWNKLCNDYRYFYKNENCVHAEDYIYEKDGVKWDLKDVGFRLRGNTSRYCPQGLDNGREQGQMNQDWNGDYYDTEGVPNSRYRQTHFKIDFEEFVDDDDELKMSGCMKGVNLKRMDASCTREIFCYDLFHRYGIWTAPRASHTRVLIKFIEDIENHEATEPTTTVDFGVYEMFEDVNKQLLKARSQGEIEAQNAWKNNKGNLWKCSNDLTTKRMGEMGVEDIRIIRADDAVKPSDMRKNGREDENRVGYIWNQFSLDLKTNKSDFSSASSELRNFITELNALPKAKNENDTAAIAEIKAFYEKWFDVDFFLKTYAVNILCGMDDDYWGNANNFYLYFDTGSKGSGKVYFIPFDYDNTLGCSIKEGGFEHDPFDWGRGADRPLMDRLFMVPEYKEKFKTLLLEVSDVSAQDSEWNYEKCSARFLSWKEMVSPYLNSPDITGRQGVTGWGDYTWQPGGYSLTTKSNNLFDATSMYFRLNLGEKIEGLDGDSVTVKIQNPNGSKSDCTLSVEVKNNGLLIKKSHNDAWDHVSIYVYDKTDSKENARIVTNEKSNEFLYPFVEDGHLYSVGLTLQSEKNSWYYRDARNDGVSVLVQAAGGLGNYRISNSGYSYHSPDYSIVFSNLEYTKPNVEYQNEDIVGSICDDGSWNGVQKNVYGLSITKSITGSVLSLNKYSEFLYGKKRIFVNLSQRFTYDGVTYEYTIISNDNNLFEDTNDSSVSFPDSDEPVEILQYETGSPSDGTGETVSITKSKENPPYNGYKDTSSDCTVTVTPRYDGLYITKAHDLVWDHVSIRVKDKALNIENIRITTNASSNEFLYPFVQKDHEYEVWLTVQSETQNWHYSDFGDMKVTVTALGGKGNYWVSQSDYRYDSPTYSIVFEDLTFARPELPGITPHIDAGVYHAEWKGENKWPSNLPLYKSVLDLGVVKSFLKGQPEIFVSVTLKFTYNEINYEYTFLENYGRLFKDTN